MADAAPKEIQERSTQKAGNVVQFVPRHRQDLIRNVVQETQQIDPTFTEEQAIPVSSHPIPDTKELRDVKAERVGAEPIIDIADVTDIMGKTAGHVVKSVGGEEELLTHAETASGPKVISFVKERRRRMEQAA